MKTTFGIKNFRVFDENGVDIELAPITILTGKNSAGKSSIVKAVALLQSFLKQIRIDKEEGKEIDLSKYRLEFNKVLDGSIGNFAYLRHKGSNERTITFEYTTHSCMLFEDVKVSFIFEDADEGKEIDKGYMHNGKLCLLSVKTLNDEEVFSTSNSKIFYNMNLIKKQFPVFSFGEFYANIFVGKFELNDDRQEMKDEAEKSLNKIDEELRRDVYKYMRSPFSSENPIISDGSDYMCVHNIEGKQVFNIPVIDECISKLDRNDIPAKVDELVNADPQLDANQKAIIKRFVNGILLRDIDFADFWKEQEELFLGEVINEGKSYSSISYEEGSSVGERMFTRWPDKTMLKLPKASDLSIRTFLWADYYECYNQQDLNEDNSGCVNEHPWTVRSITKFPDMLEIMMRLNSAYLRYMKDKEQSISDKVYEGDPLHNYKEIEDDFEYREETDVYTYTYDKRYFVTGNYSHHAYELLCSYASRAIEEILFPEWAENFFYVPSTRALPLRVYTKHEGNEFYNTLNDYLNAKTEYEAYQKRSRYSKNRNSYIPDTFLNEWLGEFGIGQKLSVESFYGAALVVKLFKNDGKEVLLTDEGFGLTQLISILIFIETTILKLRGTPYKQVFQLSKLDGFNENEFHKEQQTIAVEEPEIHLHPDFQSKLAEMFVAALEYNIHFITETHSEYLVRRVQRIVAEKKYGDEKALTEDNSIKVTYCPQKGKPYDMGWNIYGRFINFFDEGFFDVASRDAIAVSKIERNRR